MKLVFVIPEYSQKTSDHFAHLYQFIEKVALKHQVTVIAEAGDVECQIKNIYQYQVQSVSDSPINRLIQRLWWFIKLRGQGYKNFYAHYCEISTLLLWFILTPTNGRLLKWHCSQQNLYSQKWSLNNLKQKLFFDLPVELSISLAHVLVTCSPQMSLYYQKFYGRSKNSVAVLPNYICLADLVPQNNKKVNTPIQLLFVHRLAHRKGADRLIDLAVEIKQKNLPIRIKVVGQGPELQNLKFKIKNLKLMKIIDLNGSIPNSQIADFYKQADFLLMPSREEEFGRVQIEAMKYGLPILATKTISSDFVLSSRQRKLVVDQDDYLKLLDLALENSQDSKQYNLLIHEGYNQVKQFSLKTALDTFEKILNSYGKP